MVVQNIEPEPSRTQIRSLIKMFRNKWLAPVIPKMMPSFKQTHSLKPAVFFEALYHDCPLEITKLAEVLLGPEPNWAGFTPLELSDDRFGKVPKTYIRCSRDRAVTPALQDRMLKLTPCDSVVTMDTSHSPFFSKPKELTEIILAEVGVKAGRERELSAAQ